MDLITAKYRILLSLILIISAFAGFGFSCQCRVVPPCVHYSEADKVFIGKLKKTNPETTFTTDFDGTFEVQKVYKGDVAKTETIRFEPGTCEIGSYEGKPYFSVGKTYFVYATANISSWRRYCNGTSLLFATNSNLEYANNLSKKQPIFSIFGDIYGLKGEELENTKIRIKDDQKTYNLIPDQSGNYEFKTSEDKLFNVEVLFPSNINFRSNDVVFDYEDDKTIVRYSAKFIKNGCSYRTFEIEN